MATLLNSSGLIVNIDEAVPTVSGFGAPSWVKGSVGDPKASPVLGGSVTNPSGFGKFSLNGLVRGIRGSIQVTFVTGASGMQRTLGYLTDNLTTPTNRIVIGIDAMNRPYLNIKDYAGVDKAIVAPTYTAIPSGSQVTALMSWDSTQAIDGTRFALLQVNRGAVPSGDWTTNPTATWTSFQPTSVVLGFGVGTDSDFNGQILAFQISNDVVQSNGGSAGTFPSTRVFDRFVNDSVNATTT